MKTNNRKQFENRFAQLPPELRAKVLDELRRLLLTGIPAGKPLPAAVERARLLGVTCCEVCEN